LVFSDKIHRTLFLFGCCTLFLGVMLGTVPTSVPQFILLGNWLLEGKFIGKWQQLKSNKLFWVLTSIYFLHLIGLSYTDNLHDGLKDVRTKLPLLFLPTVFFTTAPISKKELHYLFYSFILGSFLNIAWCLIYNKILHQTETVRDVSRFMSHIRLGFLVDIAIILSVYFVMHFDQLKQKVIFSAFVVYFIIGLYSLGLMSGLANLIIITFLFLTFVLFKQSKLGFATLSLVFIVTGIYLVNDIKNFYRQNFEIKDHVVNKDLQTSRSGRAFDTYHFTNQVENGYIVNKNIQPVELQKEWNRRAPNDSFDLRSKHNVERYFTLVRYLSSKGEIKDSASISHLTKDDILKIAKGVSNINYQSWSFFNKRVYELMYDYFEYTHDGSVNGHSFTMRLFYLKAAACAIHEKWLFGTGTGDVQDKMNDCYSHSGSPLEKEWYKRPHNQFVTIMVALGLVGLGIFLLSLFFPIIYLRHELDALYGLFFISVIISFLFEDTLETQSGLSFFAIFNTLFLSRAYFKKKQVLRD
jgi:hypothetical protein